MKKIFFLLTVTTSSISFAQPFVENLKELTTKLSDLKNELIPKVQEEKVQKKGKKTEIKEKEIKPTLIEVQDPTLKALLNVDAYNNAAINQLPIIIHDIEEALKNINTIKPQKGLYAIEPMEVDNYRQLNLLIKNFIPSLKNFVTRLREHKENLHDPEKQSIIGNLKFVDEQLQKLREMIAKNYAINLNKYADITWIDNFEKRNLQFTMSQIELDTFASIEELHKILKYEIGFWDIELQSNW